MQRATEAADRLSNAFINEIEISFENKPKDTVISVISNTENLHQAPNNQKEILKLMVEDEFDATKKINVRNGLYLILILFISTIYSSLYLLMPQHNFIDEPQYWYDVLFIFVILGPFLMVLTNLQICHLTLKIPSMMSTKTVLLLCLSATMGFALPFSISNIVRNSYLGYNHQNCFFLLSVLSMIFIFYPVLWFEIPLNLRKDGTFRKRIYTFMVMMIWFVLITLQFKGISILIEKLPLNMKWAVALIINLARIFNLKILSKFCDKFDHYDTTMIHIASTCFVNFPFAIFIVSILCYAPQVVTSPILFGEFFKNFYISYGAFKVHISVKAVEANNWDTRRTKEVHTVILNIIINLLVPMAFLAIVSIAKYAPNEWMYDNFTLKFMSYGEVNAVSKLFSGVTLVFLVNLASSIFSAVLLRELCHLNIYYDCCQMIDQCWTLITLLLTSSLFVVNCKLYFMYIIMINTYVMQNNILKIIYFIYF